MSASVINLPLEQIAEICKRYHVTKLELFGSVLRDDFAPDSDLDFLVTFKPDARASLFDLVHLQRELKRLLGRDVDVISRPGVERSPNWIRRESILGNTAAIYVAR